MEDDDKFLKIDLKNEGTYALMRKNISFGECSQIDALFKKGATMVNGGISLNMESEERFSIKLMLTFIKEIVINPITEPTPITEKILMDMDAEDAFLIYSKALDRYGEIKKKFSPTTEK